MSKVLGFPTVLKGGKRNGVERRLRKLEVGQGETNRRLGKIETTLGVHSKLLGLLVDGLNALIEGQNALVVGQKRIIERLDRLVEATTRDRTEWASRIGSIESRLDRLEQRPDDPR